MILLRIQICHALFSVFYIILNAQIKYSKNPILWALLYSRFHHENFKKF